MPLAYATREEAESDLVRLYVDNIRACHPHPVELRRYRPFEVIERLHPIFVDGEPDT